MALRCFALTLALLASVALSSDQLRASGKARSKAARAATKSHMLSSAEANMKIRSNLAALAMKAKKYNMKLPWANLDADGGMEMERANQRDDERDTKLFSVSEYEHTSSTDDADVAEDEQYQDARMNDGDDSLMHEDDNPRCTGRHLQCYSNKQRCKTLE
jgi:hypothetical protein